MIGKILGVVGLAVCLSSFPALTWAQTGCGNIIAPGGWFSGFDQESPFEAVPITDCADPFSVTASTSPYALTIAGNEVAPGEVVPVPGGRTNDISVPEAPSDHYFDTYVFQHDGGDYRYVSIDPLPPGIGDYEAYAESYFPDETVRARYLEITAAHLANEPLDEYFYDESGELAVEGDTGVWVVDVFYDFLYAFEAAYVPTRPHLESGTYTVVFREWSAIQVGGVLPGNRSIFDHLRQWVIPTAYAQIVEPDRWYTVTFTITDVPPEPAGASSVLFLPGIQASRLYREGLLGTEDQLWEPNIDQDVRQLAMTDAGESVHDIYTRDVLDEIFGLGSVYGDFAHFMTRLVADGVIKDWTPFAYDWRYSVVGIVENGTRYEEEVRDLVAEVGYLAEESLSGQVTIIGHSNGGLLGKALISRLEAEGKADLVDRFIMIGTPQLGTPKAIGTVLHGYDQQQLSGLLIDDYTAREVITNLPGAYSLLPSSRYLSESGEAIVQFDVSDTTAPYRLAFGNQITSYSLYVDFLRGSKGPARYMNDLISIPTPVNPGLLDQSTALQQNLLDSWVAPSGIEVVEVVGTGLPTMKAIEYREINEGQTCTNINNQTTCVPTKKLKPYALTSKYGDETVMQISAEGYADQGSTYYLNLESLRSANPNEKYKHYNLTEIAQVQSFILNILNGSSTDGIEYISSDTPTLEDKYEIEVIDSPVRPVVMDETGNITGVIIENGNKVIKEEISGSQYFEFGDTKYVIIPAGTKRITTLYGEEIGNYTLSIAELGTDDAQTIQFQLNNAPVTETMVARYENTGEEYSSITTDLNGDGVFETETTLNGEPITYSYADLRNVVNATSIPKQLKKVLVNVIDVAEKASQKKERHRIFIQIEQEMLRQIENIIQLYERRGWLTPEEVPTLVKILSSLK